MVCLCNVCHNHAHAFHPPVFRCCWRQLVDRIRCQGSVQDRVFWLYLPNCTCIFRWDRQELECAKLGSNYSVWKWYLLRLCVMIWQHLVSLILMLFFLSSMYQIDSIYCWDWGSVRSMSTEPSCRLLIPSDRAWISSPSFTAPIVCDWQ